MSILTVENMSHVFGGRVIYEDVSFKLNKGEHVGFIGANGEGKSTFMKIITNKLMPDEGKIEWAKRVRAGNQENAPAEQKPRGSGMAVDGAGIC